jgi:hypothetical protein
MTYWFHPEAETEFNEAITYFEERQPGLGFDFSVEVNSAIRAILDYPAAWPFVQGSVRRCLTHRFPYGVLYSIEPDGIYILAVMHLHRDPDYWKHRLG